MDAAPTPVESAQLERAPSFRESPKLDRGQSFRESSPMAKLDRAQSFRESSPMRAQSFRESPKLDRAGSPKLDRADCFRGSPKLDKAPSVRESPKLDRSPSFQKSPKQDADLIKENAASSNLQRKGGWRTAPYIFASAACDFLSSYGIVMNMMVYLTVRLKLQIPDAATTITNFLGMCSYTPLLGAFLADAYIGRYKTILVSSVIFCVGLVWLVFTSVFDALHENEESKLGYLYLAFTIIALGAGGIRPNAASFGADQFDQRNPEERKQLFGFFNWYYFFVVIAILFSTTLLVYIQNTFGWGWGFGVPAMAMALSGATFWSGSPIYRQMPPEGSPFTRLAQVVVAAFRKRHLTVPDDPSLLYHEKRSGEEGIGLCHTMQYRFLDKAAVLTDADGTNDVKFDPWNLCSVNQVEELKSLLRMTPVWLTGIPVFIAWSQQGTLWMAQGQTMDPHFGKSSFKMPVGSLPIFAMLTMFFFLPLYDKLLMPLARKVTGHSRGISFLRRVGTGVVLTSLSMVVAALVEVRRKRYSEHHSEKMSIFMLAPQFCVVGLAEAFVTIGYLEFFYDQSPPSMRSMASAVVWAIIGTGNYLSSFLTTILHDKTKRSDGTGGWLGQRIDDVKMENFFWLLAGVVAIDFVLHLVVSKYYSYTKPDFEGEEEAPIPMI